MKMNSSRFVVHDRIPHTATRPNGVFARGMLRGLMDESDIVEVDMSHVVLTPSFADEFLGVLLVEVGEAKFRRAIRIVNVSHTSRPLLQAVLHRRASKPGISIAQREAVGLK